MSLSTGLLWNLCLLSERLSETELQNIALIVELDEARDEAALYLNAMSEIKVALRSGLIPAAVEIAEKYTKGDDE